MIRSCLRNGRKTHKAAAAVGSDPGRAEKTAKMFLRAGVPACYAFLLDYFRVASYNTAKLAWVFVFFGVWQMAQSVRPAQQNIARQEGSLSALKDVAAQNVRSVRTAEQLNKLSQSGRLSKLPREALARMSFYRPYVEGGVSPAKSMPYTTARTAPPVSAAANVPAFTRPAVPVKGGGADGSGTAKGTQAAAPKTQKQAAAQPYTGCKTCEARVYQDGSNDSGVSFQSAKHIPASTAGAAVASHEGEHVSRESDKAMREGRIVTGKTVTMQMACCPECHRIYVAGGTTTISTKADTSGTANVQSGLSIAGEMGENIDLEL